MELSTKKFIFTIVVLVVIGAVVFYFAYFNNEKVKSENREENNLSNEIVAIEESKDILVEYSQEEEKGEYTDYLAKIDLDTMTVDGSGVNISGTTVNITDEGTYYFTGTTEDANIEVDTGKDQDVVLVFDNANIASKTNAVINGIKANSITINAAENSVNTFTDASTYTSFTEYDEPNGTVFSKTDLIINGSGKFIINANYEDGIVSKDTLKIVNTNIEIIAEDDGIRGKDFTAIKNSNISIKSGGDGIKSNNDTDEGLGYVIIEDGKINIETERDGIQAEYVLNITDTDIDIKTTGDTNAEEEDGSGVSSKGLKAGTEITINSGTFNIESTDDTIHSNSYVIINDGKFSLSSGDDGIHADNNILINSGEYDITKSYEGLEANYIKINNGTISLVAADDGINVSGGADASGFAGPGESLNSDDEGRMLVINGGTITVQADGDGLDANGSIIINDGTVTVAASVTNGNGPLDYDGMCSFNGGTVIVYGLTGMWQNPSTDSEQYSISFINSGSAGDKIELRDSAGNVVLEFIAAIKYGGICFSDKQLQEGENYTLYVNGEEISSQEITSIVTSNISSGFDRMQDVNQESEQTTDKRGGGMRR